MEQEWLDTLSTINPDEVTFLDFVEAGRKLGAQLKQEVSVFGHCLFCALEKLPLLR